MPKKDSIDMENNTVWEVTPSEDGFAKFDPNFARTLTRCRTCLVYDVKSLNELALNYVPRSVVISFIYGTNITLVSAELFKVLEATITTPSLWEFTKVTVMDQTLIALRFAYRYQVRGTKSISYYLCPECGRETYMGFGERYLVGPLGQIPPIFESWPGRFLAVEHVKSQLESSISGLEFERISIRAKPADDYPPILMNERRLMDI